MPYTPKRRAEVKAERLKAGLCPACKAEMDRPDRKKCKACRLADAVRTKNNVRAKKAIIALKKLNLCVRCKNEAIPGTTRCGRCQELHQELRVDLRAKRKKEGVCLECGGRRDSKFLHCEACRKRWAKRRLNNQTRAVPQVKP